MKFDQMSGLYPDSNQPSNNKDKNVVAGIVLEDYKEGENVNTEGNTDGPEYKTVEEVEEAAEKSNREIDPREAKKIENKVKLKQKVTNALRVLAVTSSLISSTFIAKGQEKGDNEIDKEINRLQAIELNTKIQQAQADLEDAMNYLEGDGLGGDGDDNENINDGDFDRAKVLGDIEDILNSQLNEKGQAEIPFSNTENIKVYDNGEVGDFTISSKMFDETGLMTIDYVDPYKEIHGGEYGDSVHNFYTMHMIDLNGDGKVDIFLRTTPTADEFSPDSNIKIIQNKIAEIIKSQGADFNPSDKVQVEKLVNEINEKVNPNFYKIECHSMDPEKWQGDVFGKIPDNIQKMYDGDLEKIGNNLDKLKNGEMIDKLDMSSQAPDAEGNFKKMTVEDQIKQSIEFGSTETEAKEISLSNPADAYNKMEDLVYKIKEMIANGENETEAKDKVLNDFIKSEVGVRQNFYEKEMGLNSDEAFQKAKDLFSSAYGSTRLFSGQEINFGGQ